MHAACSTTLFGYKPRDRLSSVFLPLLAMHHHKSLLLMHCQLSQLRRHASSVP